MSQFRITQWFRDISISKKLNFTIGIMALLILMELFTLWFSLHLLSGVRAAVQQEGVWSKAQKDAINTLQQYAYSSDTLNHEKFIQFLEVNEWDRKAFLELKMDEPDPDKMWEGFVNSGVHPEDGNAIVDLFYYFNFISYVGECLDIFWTANELMVELRGLGNELHHNIVQNGPLDSEGISVLFTRLRDLNTDLTVLEANFSGTLGEAARWLDNLVLKLLFAIALTVEISGIFLAISLSRGISRGINEVIRVSKRVAAGDFDEKAEVYSKDEIGVLASSFNEMIDEVNQINQELKQFAYIASHDLQEPLSTIANFNALLQDPNTGWDEEKKNKVRRFIQDATLRMQGLIKDLMVFSRVGRNVEMGTVNMQVVIQDVVDQMQDTIAKTKAVITFSKLPTLIGNQIELNQLFQNLISNAIKFQKEDEIPQVNISYSGTANFHRFIVKDNGIGIPQKHQERIFAVFQRLHNANEYPGTGIGLATCKKIVNLHKGTLSVKSEEGKGSEFHFSFPKNLG